MKFKDLKLKKELLKVIDGLGFSEPTDIQKEIIPFILDGYDVVGQSQTGTGKTMAFALGLLNKVDHDGHHIRTLVLTPTRELAMQVAEEINKLGKELNVNVVAVYGSSPIENQIKAIKKGADIVVGTPGRVMDLLKRRVLKLKGLEFFVLDEADEMLNMGFREDIESIFKETKEEKQVLLFSATMPKEILRIAETYMKPDYEEVSVISEIKTAANIEQTYYVVDERNRNEAMARIMDKYSPSKAVIFCRTKKNVDDLYTQLLERGFRVNLIHGDIPQGQRINTLEQFKKGAFNYLIATDVAARGIHVDDIELVINYNLPQEHEAYVHRIGRTGRANKKGSAVTIVTPREEKIMASIARHIKTPIKKAELPTFDEIVPVRFTEIMAKYEEIYPIKNEMINDYVNTIDAEKSKTLLSVLLNKELHNSIGSDFRKDLSLREKGSSSDRGKRSRGSNANTTRVFLTIGKMDNITKGELLGFLEREANLKQGTMSGVEILSKFTFINVDNQYVDQLIKKANNKKYNKRVIKIEKAK